MPVEAAEDLVVKLTDPRNLSHEQDVEDSLIKILQTDSAVLAHSLRFLAHKVQSPSEREALKALQLLDNLAKRGGRSVQAELGKFRFLNELIKVVSPKYLGDKTAENVKKKTIETLFAWSQIIRYEQKIVEAYNMLKQQGIIRDDPAVFEPPLPPTPRAKNPIIEDDEKAKLLRRLLQSKDPADMVAANRLIKSMVREDDQRMEKIIRRHSDLVQIKENARLLLDMLKQYTPESSTVMEREIMRQLFDSCEQHRPRVFKLAAEVVESNTETEEGPNLGDVLSTSDELTEAIQQYRSLGLTSEKFDPKNPASQSDSTAQLLSLDGVAAAPVPSSSPTSALLGLGPPHAPPRKQSAPKDDVLSLLDDVFASSGSNIPAPLVASSAGPAATDFASIPRTASSSLMSASNAVPPATQPKGELASPVGTRRSLVDFDDVTHNFLGGLSLGDRNMKGRGFPVETKIKRTLADLQKEPLLTPKETAEVPLNRVQSYSGDEDMIGDTKLTTGTTRPSNAPSQNGDFEMPNSLDTVSVQLTDIEPSSAPAVTVYDQNGVKVVLHAARNRPRKDCVVFVASAVSSSSSSVKQLSYNFTVPKTMRIKVQPPSTPIHLPAFNPIFPPTPALQVLIIAKPDKEALRLRYNLNYTLDNRQFNDSGDVSDLSGIP